MKTLVCALCALIVTIAVEAQAQPSSVRLKANQGPSQALVGAGCNIGWLDETLTLNKLTVAKSHHLPRGYQIKLPRGCASEPSKQAAQLSVKTIKTDLARTWTGRLNKLTTEKKILETEVDKVQAAVQKLADENHSLRGESIRLAAENAKLRKDLAELQTATQAQYPVVVLLVLFAALVVGGGSVGFVAWRERNTVRLKERIRVLHGGRVHVFQLAKYVPNPDPTKGEMIACYRCPECGDGTIREGNFERHLDRHFGKVTVTEVPLGQRA